MEEEWLVSTETWYDAGTPKLIDSEEVRVREAEVSTFETLDQGEWTTWSLTAKLLGRGGTKWRRFFELRERFARVDYACATTVHRSQGSTFNTVFGPDPVWWTFLHFTQ